jgi:uncharacterized protein (TIGR02145 family)
MMHFLIHILIGIFLVLSVRDISPSSNPGVVIDIDGNEYNITQIGDQWWFAQNLGVTRYSNGDSIPLIADSEQWVQGTTGARVVYNFSSEPQQSDGYLYNWFAVNDNRGVCPEGWRIPSDEDWMKLEKYLGMNEDEVPLGGTRGDVENIGGILKDTTMISWELPNQGALNTYNFKASGAGLILYNGIFNGYGKVGAYWTSTLRNTANLFPNRIWMRFVSNHANYIVRVSTFKQNGLSIRCMRD